MLDQREAEVRIARAIFRPILLEKSLVTASGILDPQTKQTGIGAITDLKHGGAFRELEAPMFQSIEKRLTTGEAKVMLDGGRQMRNGQTQAAAPALHPRVDFANVHGVVFFENDRMKYF